MTQRFFAALGRTVVRFRWLVLIVWLVGTFAAVSSFPTLGQPGQQQQQRVPALERPEQPGGDPGPAADRFGEPLAGPGGRRHVGADPRARRTRRPWPGPRRCLKTVPTVKSAELVNANRHAAELLVVSSVTPFDQVRYQDPGRRPDRRPGQGRLSGRPAGAPGRGGGHQRGQPAAVEQDRQSDPELLDPVHHRPALPHLPGVPGSLRHPDPTDHGAGLVRLLHRCPGVAWASRSPSSPRSC